MRAVEVNRIDIFFELQQYRNVRDQRMRCFLCAYFLYAQEIGERRPHNARGGFWDIQGIGVSSVVNEGFAIIVYFCGRPMVAPTSVFII